jgi:Fe-S-cluster containining protein
MAITLGQSRICFGCGSCCIAHPCALAPLDMSKIADFLGVSIDSLFQRFLVLDFVEHSGRRRYYICPARKNDRAGTVVDGDWTFSSSPCIFLRDGKCSIEAVKPRGGRMYYCRYIAQSGRNMVRYGKKRAAKDWSRARLLRQLTSLASKRPVD